jgi:hypothetical protein
MTFLIGFLNLCVGATLIAYTRHNPNDFVLAVGIVQSGIGVVVLCQD